MTIIALAGRRKSGKTTSADLIVELAEEQNVHVRKVSFADPLREMFCTHTGVSMRMLLSPETKEDFRERMIAFAAELRKEDPYILIKALFRDISLYDNIVIDDMRTIEELKAIKDVGGKPYKVVSSQKAREDRGYKYNREIDDGLLETELDLCADTFRILGGGQVFNTRSTSYLKNQLFDLVKKEYKNVPIRT